MSDYTPITILRGSSSVIDSTTVVDGQILFDEGRKCLYMDNGSTREKYSGLGADSNVANVEDTTTASQPYTTGEFVVVQGQLYEVTAAIAQGDTFTVGTNITATTVGAELTQINTDLTELSSDVTDKADGIVNLNNYTNLSFTGSHTASTSVQYVNCDYFTIPKTAKEVYVSMSASNTMRSVTKLNISGSTLVMDLDLDRVMLRIDENTNNYVIHATYGYFVTGGSYEYNCWYR